MSLEFTQREEEFRRHLTSELYEDIKKLIRSEIEEQAEEIESELSYDGPKKTIRLKLPEAEDEISHDAHGMVISKYFHPKWKFRREDGTLVTLNFGQNHHVLGVDLSDPLSEQLRALQKVLTFYDVPGKDPTKKPLKPNSIEYRYKMDLHFLSHLHDKGFLRGNEPKSLNLLDVDDLRREIYLRIERDEGIPRVLGFSYAIIKWLRISKRVALPEEFAANFTLKQFRASGLNKHIARYAAAKKGRWQAINFDDLQPMLNVALTYIQNYSRDLIFVERIYEEAYKRRVKAGVNATIQSLWLNDKRTKDLIDNLLNHQFFKDVNGDPWLKIKISTYRKARKRKNETQISTQHTIIKQPIIDEWSNIVGACVFMLLIWTAMRCNELSNLTTDALRVDGKPLNLKHDSVGQVLRGRSFDLRRRVFKNTEEPGGEDQVLPLTYLGALAFATLIELFRGTRERQNTDFLFPAGGFDIHGGGCAGERGSDSHIYDRTILNWLSNFCETVGVEHHHPHQCRKTLVTLLINHDPNSLELIRRLLGHGKIEETIGYIMDMPGVGEEINKHMMESMREKIVDFIAYGAKGQVAGGAGDRFLDAIIANPKAYKGDRLPTTTQMLVKSFETTNFTIQRTPAAWCIRFPTRIPKNAPCLPPAIQKAIEIGSMEAGIDIFPLPEFCKPWKCGDAAHTPGEIALVNRSLGYAKKCSSEGTGGQSKAFYSEQVEYWESVLYQLENGRPDVVCLDIINSVIGERQWI